MMLRIPLPNCWLPEELLGPLLTIIVSVALRSLVRLGGIKRVPPGSSTDVIDVILIRGMTMILPLGVVWLGVGLKDGELLRSGNPKLDVRVLELLLGPVTEAVEGRKTLGV